MEDYVIHFLVGRLSLERGTYNVSEDVGSIKICAVLTGGVLPYSMIVSTLDKAVTAKFPSKISHIDCSYCCL